MLRRPVSKADLEAAAAQRKAVPMLNIIREQPQTGKGADDPKSGKKNVLGQHQLLQKVK